MANNQIKLYKNTGLNGSNVIDSVSSMWNDPSSYGFTDIITLTGTFPLVQEKGLAEIKIETTWEEVNAVDYLIVMSPWVQGTPHCGYFVTAITMVSTTVASLSLVVDALGTIGISNLSGIDAWCVRRIVKNVDQDLQTYSTGNIIPESWTPSNPLEMDTVVDILRTAAHNDDDRDGEWEIVIASADIQDTDNLAEAYTVASSTDDKVLVPQLKPIDTSKLLQMTMYTTYNYHVVQQVGSGHVRRTISSSAEMTPKSFRYPDSMGYNLGVTTVYQGVQKMRSLGVENVIVASYSVPKIYAAATSLSGGEVNDIEGLAYHVNTGIEFEYYSGIENKKVFALYNVFEIASIASGNMSQYKFEDLCKPSDTSYAYTQFQCLIWANPIPNGKPFCRPAYYMGNTENLWTGVVEGAQWLQTQIRYNMQSGAVRNLLRSTSAIVRDLRYTGKKNALSQMSGAINWGLGLGDTIMTDTPKNPADFNTSAKFKAGQMGVNMVADYLNAGLDAQQASNQAVSDYAAELVPDIAYPYTASVQSFVGNDFTVNRFRLSLNDARRLDAYLHKYGEAVDEPFDVAHFTDKVKYNFVQLENINMPEVLNVPLWLKNLASTVLEAGVRIWHTKPTKAALLVGGNADA